MEAVVPESPRRPLRIAVHGAGVAGPTLAWWLRHHGHEPVLFEKAPALRTGGYVIDFWGTGYDVAERMGLLPAIHAAGFQAEELRVEDADGRRRAAMGLRTFLEVTDGRYTSIQRGELARIVWEACAGIETRFGTSIDALEQRPDGVRVHSAGRAETFDLVVGTDGLHSRIRTLAFGPEEDYLHPLGLHVAAFRARGTSPRDPRRFVVHTRPGRQLGRVACGEDETAFIFIWRDESDPIAVGIGEGDSSDPVATVERVFADMGWEWPAIRELLRAAPEVYLDGVSQIRMERWTRDRVALVGDAAASTLANHESATSTRGVPPIVSTLPCVAFLTSNHSTGAAVGQPPQTWWTAVVSTFSGLPLGRGER